MAAGAPTAKASPRVLVVADTPLQQFIALTLNHGVYEVRVAAALDEAHDLALTWKPHLLVVDVELRDGDPSDLIGERTRGRRLPTIVITRRDDLKTKLDAFDRGADDFVLAPVTPDELFARSLAVMRRTYGDTVPFVPVINVAGLEMDLLDRGVRIEGRVAHLTTMEQAVLYLLISNRDTTLDRETILDAVWGSDFVAESNLVDRHIRNLRVKLKDDWRHPRYIRTVPGQGYRFVAG